MDLSKIIYFINSQKNKHDLWYFIQFEQPPRSGWRFMIGYNELDIIINYVYVNKYNITIDDLMGYLKAYCLLNISYKQYSQNKLKYNTHIFKYYYENSYSKL